jgi:zinc transport system substrate-binding protein
MLLAGCHSAPDSDDRPVVMVSIVPQKYFVNRIADTLIRVEVMVSPGSSPETYEPTALQLKLLSKAKVYFSLGLLDFERSMLINISRQNPNLNVVNHSKKSKPS